MRVGRYNGIKLNTTTNEIMNRPNPTRPIAVILNRECHNLSNEKRKENFSMIQKSMELERKE